MSWDKTLEWLEDYLRTIVRTQQFQKPNFQINPNFLNVLTQKFEAARTSSIVVAVANLDIRNETTVWTPGSHKKWRILAMVLSASVTGGLTLRDNTAGSIIWAEVIPQNLPFYYLLPGNGIQSANADNVLTAKNDFVTGPTGFSATFIGTEE